MDGDNKDKQNEIRLGQMYCKCFPEYSVRQQAPFATYDFKRIDIKTGVANGWLQVKKKSGTFPTWEIFPMTKVIFTRSSLLPCEFLVERNDRAKLFDIKEIVKMFDDNDVVFQKEIRRYDRTIDSQTWTVICFPSDWGQDIYYV